MTENSSTITTLHEQLEYDAGRFTIAEIELKKSMEEWIIKASSAKLKAVLLKYKEMIQEHIQHMEAFTEQENMHMLSTSNPIMQAFIHDTEQKMEKCTDAEIKDACLLASIQAINHYKISMYGTAAAFANVLKLEKHAAAFHVAEINEKQIDDRLTQLANFEINNKAKTPIVIGN